MSQSDIAEGIVPEKSPEHISPQRNKFEPWHKVRKHFIRRHQWNWLICKFIKERWRSDLKKFSSMGPLESMMFPDKSLKCLVIPGNDLLDVQALWEDVSKLDCMMHYIGFNDLGGSRDSSTPVHIANNRVTGLNGVVKSSEVHHDRFQSIANVSSQAYRNLTLAGPFHMVNLDFCGSLFPNTASDSDSYYAAIHRLLIYQFEKQKLPWLFFVTTYVNASAPNIEKLSRLCSPTKENLLNHSDFAEICKTLFPESVFGGNGEAINLDGVTDEQTLNLFGTAFGKWLIQLGQKSSPKWSVGMHSSYRYSINEFNGATMLSLAYEMVPNFTAPSDPSGMSQIQVIPNKVRDEKECALQILASMARIRDVDDVLSKKAALFNELVESSTILMESAGYDAAAYQEWAISGAENQPPEQ